MLKELFSRDTALKPKISKDFGLGFYSDPNAVANDRASWTSRPVGLFVLIKDTDESPDTGTEYYLLIDDIGNRLLIE
jgi:hypothetical protein